MSYFLNLVTDFLTLIALSIQKSRPDTVPEGLDIDRDSDLKITGSNQRGQQAEVRTERVRELLKYYEAPIECPDEVSGA